ncbi:MAG: hypothetical protein B6245_16280 [Desulfobacteraceae bacterium 4572_88]|nr:MAG: hypothetical protein B6245_16280 [Desulfobacteraceae bacterium 4572_88]
MSQGLPELVKGSREETIPVRMSPTDDAVRLFFWKSIVPRSGGSQRSAKISFCRCGKALPELRGKHRKTHSSFQMS